MILGRYPKFKEKKKISGYLFLRIRRLGYEMTNTEGIFIKKTKKKKK